MLRNHQWKLGLYQWAVFLGCSILQAAGSSCARPPLGDWSGNRLTGQNTACILPEEETKVRREINHHESVTPTINYSKFNPQQLQFEWKLDVNSGKTQKSLSHLPVIYTRRESIDYTWNNEVTRLTHMKLSSKWSRVIVLCLGCGLRSPGMLNSCKSHAEVLFLILAIQRGFQYFFHPLRPSQRPTWLQYCPPNVNEAVSSKAVLF